MAAFCGCCGVQITRKAEACPACGAPKHGMLLADLPLPLRVPLKLEQEGESPRLRRSPSVNAA
jgi:hypothetical protein